MSYYLDSNWFGVIAELVGIFFIIKWTLHHAYKNDHKH
jgi:hypothetical protein